MQLKWTLHGSVGRLFVVKIYECIGLIQLLNVILNLNHIEDHRVLKYESSVI